MMNFDFSRLEGKIIEVYGTKGNFIENSETLSKGSFINKLKNRVPFTSTEMLEASKLLHFENGINDIPTYFFQEKV